MKEARVKPGKSSTGQGNVSFEEVDWSRVPPAQGMPEPGNQGVNLP